MRQQSSPQRPRKVHPKLLGPPDPNDPPQTSPLLQLPLEIRLMIWSYVLTSPDGIIVYSKNGRRFYTNYSENSMGVEYRPSLITTCHEICLETLYLPLKLNDIYFPTRTAFWYFYRSVVRKEGAMGMTLNIPRMWLKRGFNYVRKIKRVEERPKDGAWERDTYYWVSPSGV